MVNTILANVGTVVCFRSGNPADERLLLPLFSPYVQEGEIANLPTYNFYARISAILSQEPVSGQTIVLEDKGSESIAQQVVVASRANYTKEYQPTLGLLPLETTMAKKRTQTLGAARASKPHD
jgi:hypothetical protein